MAPVSRDGVSVALQADNGATFLGAATARVSRMLERLDTIPEFAKAVADEGSGAAATGSTPVTYVWSIDAGASREIDTPRPTFAIQFKDIPGVSPDDVIPVIVRLSPTASNGRFVGAARGRADEAARPGAEWDLTREWKQDVMRSTIEMIGRGAARIQPAADLQPGEYAIVLRMHRAQEAAGRDRAVADRGRAVVRVGLGVYGQVRRKGEGSEAGGRGQRAEERSKGKGTKVTADICKDKPVSIDSLPGSDRDGFGEHRSCVSRRCGIRRVRRKGRRSRGSSVSSVAS